MKYCFVTIILAQILLPHYSSNVYAQPNVLWMKEFDDGGSECFLDVYACENGDYALCGTKGERGGGVATNDILVVSLSEAGEVNWSEQFGNQNVSDAGYSIIEADNADLVVGGVSNGLFTLLRLSSEGDMIWLNNYSNLNCNAVIELKNGNFLLTGRTGPGTRARLVCIDGQGDLIWENSYGFVRGGETYLNEFWGIRETDGGVVAAGQGWNEERSQSEFWAVKASIEEEGEPIWSHYYPIDAYGSCRGLVSSGDGGFALTGIVSRNRVDSSVDFGLLRIDARGEEIWNTRYHFGEDNFVEYCNGIARLDDRGFVLVGFQSPGERYRPAAMRVRPDGSIRWQQLIELREEDGFGQGAQARHGFFSVIEDHNNSIVAVGRVHSNRNDTELNGLVVKLEPQPMGIGFISYTPQDTVFNVLVDDTVNFAVIVRNNDQLRLDFNWEVGGQPIESDSSSVKVVFREGGQTEIQCIVEAEELRISIRWHVTVTDLYISAFTPDTLNISVNRGDSLTFAIDTVRFIGDVEPAYLWTVTNLNNGQSEQVGEDSSATITFPHSGSYSVVGKAYRWESSDSVVWNVFVKGTIQAYIPEALAFDVEPDGVVHFEVVPSEPENESLSIQWLVDGEVAAEDTVALEWSFAGSADLNPHYQVSAIVADSVEADTVTWEVTVRDLGVGGGGQDARPTDVGLLSVSPNPFNSMLTIRFSGFPTARWGGTQSPHAIAGGVGGVSLAIYDVTGREVANLSSLVFANEVKQSSSLIPHPSSLSWNASSVPAGVYLVRLQSDTEISTRKVVLMR